MAAYNKFESEKFFLETMTRIQRNKVEYKVLYINISKLKPKNRHSKFVRVVARMFDNMVAIAEGTMFVFNNGDIVILGKNITENLVDESVEKLRRGLITDPIWTNQGVEQFAKLYSYEDFDSIIGKVNELILSDNSEDAPQEVVAVDAGQIEAVKAHLDGMDIVDIIKHQSVIKIEKAGQYSKLFEEFYVAVKDLSANFDKSLDLTANKWLFLYLTQTLDKKTMASFKFSSIKNKIPYVSVNLNLSSLFSPEFDSFIKLLKDNNQSLIAEIQIMDIINNMQAYLDAKELLHRAGCQILLDAASLEMLQALSVDKFAPDYIKIFWHPLMEDYQIDDNVKNMLNNIGMDKIILAKSIDEKALRWGIKQGIRSFQGPYIDNLEVALIRNRCPSGKTCSASECLKRKKLIAGAVRSRCAHLDILESGVEK